MYKCAEGRLENNNIMCAYHAWSFNSKGDLVDVPQAHFTGEPDGNARACASRRACVAAYPALVSTLPRACTESGMPRPHRIVTPLVFDAPLQ